MTHKPEGHSADAKLDPSWQCFLCARMSKCFLALKSVGIPNSRPGLTVPPGPWRPLHAHAFSAPSAHTHTNTTHTRCCRLCCILLSRAQAIAKGSFHEGVSPNSAMARGDLEAGFAASDVRYDGTAPRALSCRTTPARTCARASHQCVLGTCATIPPRATPLRYSFMGGCPPRNLTREVRTRPSTPSAPLSPQTPKPPLACAGGGGGRGTPRRTGALLPRDAGHRGKHHTAAQSCPTPPLPLLPR